VLIVADFCLPLQEQLAPESEAVLLNFVEEGGKLMLTPLPP
jgi:hypothetical protein